MAHLNPIHFSRFQLSCIALKSIGGKSLSKKMATVMFAIHWLFAGRTVHIKVVW